MTISSLFGGGRVLYDDTKYAADAPLSTHFVATLASNVLHVADSAGQVRVAWPARSDVSFQAAAASTSFRANGRIPLPIGPFPILLTASGDSYTMRVRLAGFSSTGTSVSFRLILAPSGRGLDYAGEGSADNILDFTTTGTSTAWLTPDGGADPVVQLPADDVAFTALSVVDSNGDARTAQVPLCELVVLAKEVNTSAIRARLTGLYAAEHYVET